MINIEYMRANLIKEAAQGNIFKEIQLLEVEVANGTREMEVFTSLSQLYRKNMQYSKAINILEIGLKTLNHNESSK